MVLGQANSELTQIKSKVETFFADSTFQSLRRRWDDDFDLYRKKPYDAGKGYYSYTTNSAKNLAEKVISMVMKAKLIISVPEELLTDEQKNIASNTERFFFGSLGLNDRRLARLPETPSLHSQMSWHAVVRGGFAYRVFVRKLPDGSTLPEVIIWDLYNTAYDYDEDGLLWAAYVRKATRAQIMSQYPNADVPMTTSTTNPQTNISNNLISVIDYWDRENNSVIVGSTWAKAPEAHGQKYTPVFVAKAGAMPPIWQERYEQTAKHQGESIYAINRGIYDNLNKTISDLLTLVRRGVKPPMGYWSSGGLKSLDEDIFQVEKAGVLPMDLNDKFAPLIEPTMPADYANLLNWLSGEDQRGGLSHVAQGELGFRLSGFAIQTLQNSIEIVQVPFVEAIESAYETMLETLAQQYHEKSWTPVKVRGRTSKGVQFGVPMPTNISPDDVDPDFKPEVKLAPVLPKDDIQKAQLARLLSDGDNPLLSQDTTRTDILEVADSLHEEEKISKEKAKQLPIIQLYEAFEAFIAAGRPDKAMNVVAELNRLMAGQISGGGSTGAAGVNPIKQDGLGVPSNVLPSEANSDTPPGAASARPGGQS